MTLQEQFKPAIGFIGLGHMGSYMWLLKRSSTMLPIPGTSSVKHLEENIVGAMIRLSQEEFDAIDRASK